MDAMNAKVAVGDAITVRVAGVTAIIAMVMKTHIRIHALHGPKCQQQAILAGGEWVATDLPTRSKSLKAALILRSNSFPSQNLEVLNKNEYN